MCRRRDRLKWDDTPLKQVFSLEDQYHLVVFRATVVRIVYAIQKKGLKAADAFNKFDVMADNKLNSTEFANACIWLGIPVDHDDIAELIDAADKDKDGLLDYSEWISLLQLADSQDTQKQTELRRTPSTTLERLILTPEFQAAYERDEEKRLKKVKERQAKEASKVAKTEAIEEAKRKKKVTELEKFRKMEEEIIARKKQQMKDYGLWECKWDHQRMEAGIETCDFCQRPRKEVEAEIAVSPIETYSGKPVSWKCPICAARKLPDADMPWGLLECWRHKGTKRPEPDKVVVEKRVNWICPTCGRFNPADETSCDIDGTQRPSQPVTK